MQYSQDDLRVIGVIFGPKGVELAMHVQPVASDQNLTNIPTEEGEEASIEHTEEGFDDPFVRIHEFAHLYCAKVHGDLLKDQPNIAREELCAVLAEYAVAIASTDNFAKYWMGRRLPVMHPAIMGMLTAFLVQIQTEPEVSTPTLTSDYFHDILSGKYG